MSALAMILTAVTAIPASGPEMPSGEATDQPLDLRGEWEGTLTCGDNTYDVHLADFTLTGSEWSRIWISNWEIQDQGWGRFRLSENNYWPYLGLYAWCGESIVLCYREAKKGTPTSFKTDDDHHILILRRVKPQK